MLLIGSAVVADGARFKEIALPSLEPVLDRDDVILCRTGDRRGIASIYNEFIAEARTRSNCEALVLLHDDVEVVDPNFRPKILAAVGEDDVGVVGAIGGAGLRSAEWWAARRTAGSVFETRGLIELGPRRADVDVVDGLLLVLAPSAFLELVFDEQTCPRFHGYDVDYCLQVRAAGLRVTVRPIEVLHRTKGGFGDQEAFNDAAEALAAKWPTYIRPPTRLEMARGLPTTLRQSVRTQGARFRRAARAVTKTAGTTTANSTQTAVAAPARVPEVPAAVACLACSKPLGSPGDHVPVAPRAIVCDSCGSGLTWPPPQREVEGAGLWAERYGDARLARRETWFSEGRKRLEWLQLYVPDGCLLEVGCGTGEFVKVAQDDGFDAFGVEPSLWAAQHARTLGVPVETGFLSDWVERYPGLRPDAVCLWHVIEHVPDPLEFLKDISSTLKPGGWVFLEVPNFASTAAERLGMEWDGAQPLDHFTHFTPDGLLRLLDRSELRVLQILPMTRRIYESGSSWRGERNSALLERHPWPPLDLLRGIARSPGDDATDGG